MDFFSAKDYMLERLDKELSPGLFYHSKSHTLQVIEACKMIGEVENLPDYELFILLTAALYHDSGFIYTKENHEEASIRLAENSLPQFGYQFTDIDKITSIIAATKSGFQPTLHLQKILCDADLSYLGSDGYFETANALRKEWEFDGTFFNLKDWYKLQVNFLSNHNYITGAAQNLYNEKKLQNLIKIEGLLKS